MTQTTKKTLYFEGAGWSGADISKATIGNCRIRTAFHLDNGKAVYLEITACERGNGKAPYYEGWVDSCHYITGSSEDCNRSRIKPAILHFDSHYKGRKFDICVDAPNDPDKLPILTKENAVPGALYVGAGYGVQWLHKVYRISEEHAERYQLMYLDRCETSNGDFALPGSDLGRWVIEKRKGVC